MVGRLLVALSLALLLSSCATKKEAATFSFNSSSQQLAENFVRTWPPAGEDVPRYAYVGELRGEENFVRNKQVETSIEKIWNWLTGLALEYDRPQVTRPQAILVAKSGEKIWVADVGRQSILVFDRSGGEFLEWKSALPGIGFVQPIAIAESLSGGIYVSDAELAVVLELDRSGEPVRTIGRGLLQRPTGIAVDPVRGRLWVVDTTASDIKVFDLATGEAMFVVGELGEESGQFNRPTFVTLKNDRVFISDTLNARVQVLRAEDGEFERMFGRRGQVVGDFVRPKGIAVDSENNVYVVESYHDQLLVYDHSGRFLLNVGGTGEGVGEFYAPSAMWIDEKNQIYVGDMMNSRVVVFKFLGGGR